MLAAALGPNRAAVRVDAVIDTAHVSETTETYDPENKVVSKEELMSKSSTPIASGEGTAAAGSKTQEENTVSEYMVSRVVQEKSDLPGKIVSLSVAAFVDLTPPAVAEGQPAPATLKVNDVEEIIRNAMGLKASDTLKVAQTSFPQAAAAGAIDMEEEGSVFTDPNFLLEMARRVSLGILVIGGLLVLKMMRGKKTPAEASGESLALEGQGSANNLLPGGSPANNPELLRAQITHALQENPEAVKRLFLRWIESEKGAG